MLAQFYVIGSNGFRNLFLREGKFVIQWDGSPEHDSGYHSWTFSTLEDALLAFDELNG